MSISREVLFKIPEAVLGKPTLELDLENLPGERTLGVQCDVGKDAFLFKVREPHQPPTKRGILSAVSLLFDPWDLFAWLSGKLRRVCKYCGS